MDAIGGYMSFENMPGEHFHDTELRFNSGRSAMQYLIKMRGYRHIYLPYYICDCVEILLKKLGIGYSFFPVSSGLLPDTELRAKNDEALLIVNYFGMMSDETVKKLKRKHGNIILDNTQAFFAKPPLGVDTIYTARKFFGTADGAYLCSDVPGESYLSLPEDQSAQFAQYLFGRSETSAEDYYAEFRRNEERLDNSECRKMSASTDSLLRVIDYESALKKRKANYEFLNERLYGFNELDASEYKGYFMYPLLIENGSQLRSELIKRRIFVPCLWKNVLESCKDTSCEWNMAENCVMLPIDQRYGSREMEYICSQVRKIIGQEG